MSLIKDYFEKTKKHVEEYGALTIVLIQVGAFFEVYGLKDTATDSISGSNIMDFSRICDLNVVDKKVCCGSNPVVMAGFKDHLLDKYVKKLQDAGYTVAVYEQDEQCANTTRSLTGVYSPGTYFSNDSEQITNNTCCIWIETKKMIKNKINKTVVYVGASIVDIYTGTTSMMEYNENYMRSPTTFDDLERFISIYNPSETIIISNLTTEEIDDIVSFANIKSKSLHIVSLSVLETETRNVQRALNCEKQVYQSQLLNKFYNITDLASFMEIFNDNVYATQSFCYLLDFIYQHNPNLIYKIEEPKLENNSKRLVLANHSLKQLNIIDDDNYKGKYSSVSKMLNECITPMGRRRFTYQFLNPTTDEEYLQTEYDIIEHLISEEEDYQVIKIMLVHIKDVSKLMRQIMLQKISPKALYQLYAGICSAKLLYDYIVSREETYLVEYLKKKIDGFPDLLVDISELTTFFQDKFILEECKELDSLQKLDKSFIKEGVDATLDLKMRTLMDSQDQMEACRAYFNSIVEKYETTTKKKSSKKLATDDGVEEDSKSYVKIHETEKNNFSLIATDRRCKIIEEVTKPLKSVILKYKSSFSGETSQFVLSLELEYNKQSSSNKTISNNQIYALCKNVGTIKINLMDTIVSVYQNTIKALQEYQDKINNIIHFITYVDLVYAKAFMAIKYDYCKPEIVCNDYNDSKSFVDATDLRHCLIEKIQQSELYVANDISLGKGTSLSKGVGLSKGVSLNKSDEKKHLDGILLYGTNAVGKTSFIRALGISVIMAQAGLYVPASSYKYKPYKYIFTRILGNDNIFKGLSTFAVEMSEFRTILRLASKNSLVLGDELCSGTETPSAISIFVAGIQALHNIGCSFIFATHLHEIVNFDEIAALHNVGMKHMSVIYDKERDCLVYNRKLQDGQGNSMYGLEVCKSLTLPPDFLENAYNIRMKYYPEMGTSVLDLKGSHYNAKHISGGFCDKCKINVAVDVHHLQHQSDANEKGLIKKGDLTFKKNNAANLINLCQKCHDEIHKSDKKYKKTKTTKGVKIEEIQ